MFGLAPVAVERIELEPKELVQFVWGSLVQPRTWFERQSSGWVGRVPERWLRRLLRVALDHAARRLWWLSNFGCRGMKARWIVWRWQGVCWHCSGRMMHWVERQRIVELVAARLLGVRFQGLDWQRACLVLRPFQLRAKVTAVLS